MDQGINVLLADTRINVVLALMIIASFLAAIALHEYGHALMAYWLGDHTGSTQERLTLSLRPHIDPVGTLLCVVLAFQPLYMLPVALGWGKPVKPDPWKMKVGANSGVLIVACAGPLFNLIIGVLAGVLVHFLANFQQDGNVLLVRLLQLLIVFATVNICLTLFNLLPLYPLDGYQILYALLPSKQAVQFARSAPYGPFIVLILLFFLPFLGQFFGPGASDFILFRLPYYIGLGAVDLVSLFSGLGNYRLVDLYIR